MRQSGIHVTEIRNSLSHFGYLAGSDEERARELNLALAETDADFLICARGGYGTLRLLSMIDYEAAKNARKILIGYSDITALQLALLEKSNWNSISGPMPGVDWPEPDSETFNRLSQLFSEDDGFEIIGPGGELLEGIQEGLVEGRLIGGNLSLITKLVGSPFLPDLRGSILFIEEVSEAPYQLDGHFAQLELSGELQKIGGLVCGQFTDWESDPKRASQSYKEVVQHYASKHGIPTAWNLQYGHIPVKNSMPIGVKAKLIVERDKASLTILESVCQK